MRNEYIASLKRDVAMNQNSNPTAYATLSGLPVGDGYPVRIMGIINVSPESFFRTSVVTSKDAIKKKAARLVAEGVDIIDIGGRSTMPYIETSVSEAEEIDRMIRAVEIVREVTDTPISANTKYSNVARAAREAGATILNDVSGLAHDVLLPEVAKTYDGIILTANADYANVLDDPVTVVRQTLRDALQRAQHAGIPMDKTVLDPGIGFFRNKEITWEEWDREMLRNLAELRSFHVPIAVGLSRKSFIGKVLGYEDPADRLYGSLGLTSLAVMRGAHIIRTHDVAATRDVVRIAQWFAGERFS